MSMLEVIWRLGQRRLQARERRDFEDAQADVCERVFRRELVDLRFDAAALHLNLSNASFGLNETIDLLGFDYKKFEGKWHAGFQTSAEWPRTFSYDLDYKGRDDIGDARTNWELNRHFQFAILAKNYYASQEAHFLEKLEQQLDSWRAQNPFLVGIAWTSVMEVAIRAINWTFALAFLEATRAPKQLRSRIATGIVNMISYVAEHRSRFSSANNHLLVEAAAMVIVGIAFHHNPWIEAGTEILDEELPRQNYKDGVNKELSLHYQVFGMEAYALVVRLLRANGKEIPPAWASMLRKQSRFVAACRGNFGEVVVFGDDDEGKILDLAGRGTDRYAYILQFASCLLDEKYLEMLDIDETLRWLFSSDEIAAAGRKPLYDSTKSACYQEGGNTILKSRDGCVLIGIDHAALGFGSIAAHGHADALSFQVFFDGRPLFVDPGTYVYHCNRKMRDELRRTRSHNTVCIDGKDQSEMLGAFLWGKRAECRFLSFETQDDGCIKLIAEHDGYSPIIHKRTFEFDGKRKLRIHDELTGCAEGTKAEVVFVLAPGLKASIEDDRVRVCGWNLSISMQFQSVTPIKIRTKEADYSRGYGLLEPTQAIVVSLRLSQGIVELVADLEFGEEQ